MVPIGIRYGKGLQLVNILRDLPQDLQKGRCYVPLSLLHEVGLQPKDLLHLESFPVFRPILRPVNFDRPGSFGSRMAIHDGYSSIGNSTSPGLHVANFDWDANLEFACRIPQCVGSNSATESVTPRSIPDDGCDHAFGRMRVCWNRVLGVSLAKENCLVSGYLGRGNKQFIAFAKHRINGLTRTSIKTEPTGF